MNISVNETFNAELRQQIAGTLPRNHIYQLGTPSEALLSNLQNVPIEMAASTLEIKSSRDYKSSHPFDLEDIFDLPDAIALPIAVFESENDPNRTVLLTALKDKNGINFIAIINISQTRGRNAKKINSIISIYPKESNIHIAKWFLGKLNPDVGRDILKWVDKKKAFEWLANNASNVRSVGIAIKSVAKVIQSFDNPQSFDRKNAENSSLAKEQVMKSPIIQTNTIHSQA